jgi:LmbE family N-acetylglucosaminyl deacetylase
MKRKKVLVISPHLDDAVLSCAEYLLWLKKSNYDIHVLTVFTSFANKNICREAMEYMRNSGVSNQTDFEAMRKKEDGIAMNMLGVRFSHLDFTDGWFRSHGKTVLYPGRELFLGKVSSLDSNLMSRLMRKMREYTGYDLILAPFGVGKHVDHIICRNIISEIFNNHDIHFYCEYPYFLHRANWTAELMLSLILKKKRMFQCTDNKRKILNAYKSQIPLLFKDSVNYSEIILIKTEKYSYR